MLGPNKGRIGSGQSGSQAGNPFGKIGNLNTCDVDDDDGDGDGDGDGDDDDGDGDDYEAELRSQGLSIQDGRSALPPHS